MTTDTPHHEQDPEEPTGPVIHDRRRIDPVTGEVRPGVSSGASSPAAAEPAAGAAEAGAPGPGEAGAGVADQPEGSEVADLKQQVAERTADLQRLQAEYLNYKRRVERDREAIQESALAGVLIDLLPVLDDIGRAREHGELDGGFKAVAEALEAALNKLGLVRFGEVGDPFDPHVHEALMHSYSDQVSVVSTSAVLQPGYRLTDRVLRPARVAVAEPTEALPPDEAADAAEGAEGTDGSGPTAPDATTDGQADSTAGTSPDEPRPGQG